MLHFSKFVNLRLFKPYGNAVVRGFASGARGDILVKDLASKEQTGVSLHTLEQFGTFRTQEEFDK